MPPYSGFIGGSNQSQSVIADGERTVNLYVEQTSPQGQPPKVALYPIGGQQNFLTVPDIGDRAALSVNGRTFKVIGPGFYEVFANNLFTRWGTVAQDANLAQIVANGPTYGQLGIASGGNFYVFTLATNTLSAAILTGEATQIGMIDGFFLVFNLALAKVRISALGDGTSMDPTQFALRTAQPDPWQALLVNGPDIWLLGEQTGDVWYDAGTAPFPLAPRQGLTVPFGIAAPFSLAVSGGSVFWLTRNKDGAGQVVSTRGYSPQRISSHALETALAGYQRTSTIADAEALVYQDQGHTFYVLRFPTANATWAYDVMTGLWAERGRWNPGLARYDVWGPRVHCYAFGQHLVGDATTGGINTLDVAFGSEADGSAIRRLRRGPVLVNENRRLPISRFELSLEAGLGANTGQGVNPQIMFRGSNDGGKTFGNERQAAVGRIGQYHARAVWSRRGAPRLWVPEITMTDPIPWRIVDAFLNNHQRQAA
jgi:hypothetical protein